MLRNGLFELPAISHGIRVEAHGGAELQKKGGELPSMRAPSDRGRAKKNTARTCLTARASASFSDLALPSGGTTVTRFVERLRDPSGDAKRAIGSIAPHALALARKR